jgi:hypothetical protein
MNGTGLKTTVLYPRRHLLALQLKLSLGLSALAVCTYTPQDLSRGNGTTKSNISTMYSPFSRLMIITGTLTLITAITFL